MRGHETPENHPLTILKGFSTVSEESVDAFQSIPNLRKQGRAFLTPPTIVK